MTDNDDAVDRRLHRLHHTHPADLQAMSAVRLKRTARISKFVDKKDLRAHPRRQGQKKIAQVQNLLMLNKRPKFLVPSNSTLVDTSL